MEQVSGKEAYETRYVPVSRSVLRESGAQFEVIYRGVMVSHLIGPTANEVRAWRLYLCRHPKLASQWDEVMMLRYPNREELIKLSGSPSFAKGMHHRTAALQDSRLIISLETAPSL
jgi:hypothetical protein